MIRCLILLLVGCSFMKSKQSPDSFKYQLQNYSEAFFERISSSSNAVWVIDPYKDGRTPFSTFEILSFKSKTNTVIAYLSLGEAEDYRSYFSTLPKELILFENKNWKGNYVLKYWYPQWHEIIYKRDNSLLNNIINQGFDGVFLDVVDVYKRFNDKALAAKRMAKLVINLSVMAKTTNPKFLVNIQNGFDILMDLPQDLRDQFLNSVDGISIEAHFFNYTPDEVVLNPWFKDLEPVIDMYRKAGKSLYMIEYVVDEKQRRIVEAYCKENGIKLLLTNKELDGKGDL